MKQVYEDKKGHVPAFLTPEEAEAAMQARKLFWMIIRVLICAAAIAVLVLSHVYPCMIPVLQIAGVMTLIVIAAINIDRYVRK